eukprot:scpid37906/ scgid10262/ Probable RNA-directed DNA polymerase from transposon X-element; Reverse transcriptase
MHHHKVDILAITETWLTNTVPNNSVHLRGYSIYRRDRQDKTGGGVCIYVRDGLQHNRIGITNDIEAVSIHVRLQEITLNIIAAYRSPSTPVIFWQKLTDTVDNISGSTAAKSHTIVIGDFNVNVQNHNHPHYTHLQTFCSDNSLRNVVLAPTRLPSNSTIDLALVPNLLAQLPNSQPRGNNVNSITCSVQPCDVSDHQLVILELSTMLQTFKEERITIRKPPLRAINIQQFQDDISSRLTALHNNNTLPSEITLNEHISLFQTSIADTLDKHCPTTTITTSPRYKPSPWVDGELRQLLYRRKRAHRKMIQRPDDQRLTQAFRALRRESKLLMRRKKAAYFQNELTRNNRNPRLQWKTINSLLGRTTVYHEPHASVKDISATFARIVSPMGAPAPATPAGAASTVTFGHLNVSLTAPQRASSAPLLSGTGIELPIGPMPEPSLTEFEPVSAATIVSHLKRLDSHKASGPDKIPPSIYKLLQKQIAPSLAQLFTISFRSGIFPSLYKIANVRPIHKRGSSSDPSNYRPISLLPIASKLLERCAYEQIMSHIQGESFPNALPNEQFAYRKQHSCEDLLATTTNDWQACLDKGQFVVAAFLDLSKAFDTVNHASLLQELFSIGVGGTALQWIASFLCDRRQRVVTVTKHQEGEQYTPTRGVPQGSTLGPALFNLSVRALPSCTITSKVRQFADDVSMYKAGTNLQKLTDDLSADISVIREYLRDRGLNLNNSKTQFIIIRQKTKCVPPNICLRLGDVLISPTPTVKYLGLTIDEHLSFSSYVTEVEKKVGTKLAMFRKIRDNLTPAARKTFYCSFIQAH